MEQKKNNIKKATPKKKSKGKFVLIGLGIVAIAGTAIYFATRKKKVDDSGDLIDLEPETLIPAKTNSNISTNNTDFPLKRGSRGDLVRKIQEVLIEKFGSNALPKYGADGIWGDELQNALVKLGIPTLIDETTYNKWMKMAKTLPSVNGVGDILCDQIKSIQPTHVWNQKGKRIKVPKDTILGRFLDAKNGVTKFKTLDNNTLFTNTKCICYV